MRVKSYRISVLITMVLLFFFVSGCTNKDDSINDTGIGDKELITSYEDEHVPAFIEKSGENWFVIYQKYGESDYSFAAGDSPNTTDIKHKGTGEIWKLSADGDCAAWAERMDIGVNINLYDANNGEVKTIAVLPEGPDEPQQIYAHIKDGKVYYCLIDYEKKEKLLMCYEIENKKGSILAKESDYQRGFLSISDDTIMYESKKENGKTILSLIDTVTGKEEQIPLPEGNDILWNVDIDGEHIATYYHDNRKGDSAWHKNDNIAVFRRGEEDVMPIFSFPKTNSGATYYAYHDDLELMGDNVLWIYQQNVSGDILDHYQLTIYNYKTNMYISEPATFCFMTDEDDLYWISWNSDVNHADLYRTTW